jgi:hypothetical protein
MWQSKGTTAQHVFALRRARAHQSTPAMRARTDIRYALVTITKSLVCGIAEELRLGN